MPVQVEADQYLEVQEPGILVSTNWAGVQVTVLECASRAHFLGSRAISTLGPEQEAGFLVPGTNLRGGGECVPAVEEGVGA